MKKCAIVGLLFILSLGTVQAQDKIEVFGYFESQIMGAEVKDDFFQLYTNKLRVDLKSSLSDNITFAANFDYITYHGKTEWNILDFLTDRITSTIPEAMRSVYVIPFSNENFLDNAYMKLSFKYFDFTIGKQQVSLGTGYVWNPTDVFNIKDILDPTYEQPGHMALRLDVPVSSVYTLTFLYSPEESWQDSGKMVQFKGRISHFDYAVIVIETVWRFHDYTRFNLMDMNFLESPEKRRLLGGSTAGELLGVGIWAEGAYSWMEASDDFYELVLGGDYTFDFQTYVMAEYYRSTLGKTDHELYDLNDWMRVFAQEQKAVCRDQVYVLLQHPVTDLMSAGLSGVFSVTDGSMALIPTLSYSFSDNVDIYAYLNLNLGEEGKVFGRNMGNGGLIRVRVYF